ncbi:MAG: asparaginase [Streptomycetaceae bacterium]|nr:asparaginase [Mycobacteriaceae bacterium]NUS57261.1 asparaginase [Streptomycetaceae bacterium]
MSVELVEVVRSGFRECVHRGSAVILRPDGTAELELGAVHAPIFPRSTNKPMQALALLRCGFEPVDAAELAIVAASHYGEPEHIRLVRRLMERHGVAEDLLGCPPDLPLAESARAAAVTATGPARIYMNCSGKHAAMLAACLHNDWPVAGYLEPGHPLQKVVIETIAELTGQASGSDALGVDGCGLPIVPVSLTNLARAYARFVTATPDLPQRRVADAVRAHPRLISGTDAPDERLMTATPGLFCKIGADGVHAGALPDGATFAYKLDDGHDRARVPLTAALLRRIGAPWTDGLAAMAETPVLGGSRPVGSIRVIPGVL